MITAALERSDPQNSQIGIDGKPRKGIVAMNVMSPSGSNSRMSGIAMNRDAGVLYANHTRWLVQVKAQPDGKREAIM